MLPLILGAGSHRTGLFMPVLIVGNSLAAVKPVPGFTLSPWAGLGIVALYAVITLGAGCWLLARRDV